jgi:hypothetical protein
MNSREYQEIQKAYFEVYEIDEANRAERELDLTSRERTRARNLHQTTDTPIFYGKKNTALKDRSSSTINAAHKNMAAKRRGVKEEADLYDVILSHLLDEGYADTLEAAEGIMVSMSEEWREEILDEANTVMSVSSPSGNSRELNKAKAKPSRNLEGQERLAAARDIRQKDVNRRAPEIEKRIKGRHRIRINP